VCLMLRIRLVGRITHRARLGVGNTLPPHPSLQTPRQIMQHYESEHHGYSAITAKTTPENGQPCRASLQQRLVSASFFGCQLLSAHTQALFRLPKIWANLFDIATDQGKKKNRLKKAKLNLGTLFLGEVVMDLSFSPSSRPQRS